MLCYRVKATLKNPLTSNRVTKVVTKGVTKGNLMKILGGFTFIRNWRFSNLVLATPDLWQVWGAVSRHVYQVTP